MKLFLEEWLTEYQRRMMPINNRFENNYYYSFFIQGQKHTVYRETKIQWQDVQIHEEIHFQHPIGKPMAKQSDFWSPGNSAKKKPGYLLYRGDCTQLYGDL